MYDPATGYSQGMSDLVAPILAEVLDESDTFWCFVGLMQNTIFVSSPRDEDMEKQLVRRGHGRGQGAGRQVLEAACGVAAVGTGQRKSGACIADGDRGLVPGPQGKDQLSREGRRALPWWLPASCSNMPASPLGRGGSAPAHLALSFIKWVLRCIWAALCRGPGTGGAWDGRSS